MSLWSPVDLVNGGSGTRNVNTNNNSLTNEILEQINAKLFTSQMQQPNFSNHDDNTALYNQLLLQNSMQLKNKLSSSILEQEKVNSQDNSSRNRNNDNQKHLKSNQLTQNLNNKSSNKNSDRNSSFNFDYGSNASSSKRSLSYDQNIMDNVFNNSNVKKQKTTHQQQQQQQMNQQHFQLLQAQIQMQLAQIQQQQQLQQALNINKIQNQMQMQQLQKQQMLKQQKNSNQPTSSKNESNNKALSNQQAAGLIGLTGDMPLDLCVKKNESEMSLFANQLRNNSLLPGLNNDLLTQLENEQLLDTLMKKKGRKSKTSLPGSESLINSSSLNQTMSSNYDVNNSNMNTAESHLNSLIDNKPRKRGRPPASTMPQSKVDTNDRNPQNNLANTLALMQAAGINLEMFNSPAGKAAFLPLLAAAASGGNSRNNEVTQEAIAAQLSQQINNQIKAMQAQLFGASSSTSSAVGSNRPTSCTSSNNNFSNTSNVVIEEYKQDQFESGEESDVDSQSSKDQSTFVKNYDERSLRIPCLFNWKRQTFIKIISKSGVRGDVVYISPCGKKLKNFSEVDKYLMKSNKNNLRKEHFNFSPRIIIGEFLEPKVNNPNEYKTLSESDIINKIESIRRSIKKSSFSKNNSSLGKKNNSNSIIEFIDNNSDKNKFDVFNNKLKEEEHRRLLELQREEEIKRKKEQEFLIEQEKERRKQHSILVKTIETYKRVMDRDKKITYFNNEKRFQQDRRNLKKKIELEISKEIKKPVEDMMLKDLENLHTLNRIPGLKLSGKAFADLLMVNEFLHNFYECLNLEKEKIPSLNVLQNALLNSDENSSNESLEILRHLLAIAIDDPGLPYNPNTLIGQKLKDITINSLNITEVLKLYFQSYVSQIREDSSLERVEFRIYNVLDLGKHYLSLNSSIKVEILAYICNELLCNQSIIKKIEDRIENASNLKRDKWVIENELKKYKLLKVKREKKEDESLEDKIKPEKPLQAENEDSSDSDRDSQVYGNEIDGEDKLSIAEIDKNIEKLTKSTNNMANKLNKVVNSYRVTSFGQDRYRRRYWCLPNAGAVFIESMESCELVETLKLLEEEEEALNNEDEEDEEEEENEENDDIDEEEEEVEDSKDNVKVEKIEKDHEIEENKFINSSDIVMEDTTETSIDNSEIKKENDLLEVNEEEKNDDIKTEFDPIKTRSRRDFNNENKDNKKKDILVNNNKKLVKEEKNSVDQVKKDKNLKDKKDNEAIEDKKQVELPNYLDVLNSEYISPIITKVYLDYPQTRSSVSNSIKETVVLPGMEFLSKNQTFSKNVFSIIPRSSCCKPIPNENLCSNDNLDNEESYKKLENLDFYKINDVCILPQDLDIDATLQNDLIELKKLEYKRPKRIPNEFRNGWWRITDTSQLRQLADSMHERASRERNLKKHILKYFNNLTAKMRQNNVEFDITDLDRIISQECPYGAPLERKDDEWSEDIDLKLDILVLELVEGLEETIASSSMQIRGWKPLPKIDLDERDFNNYQNNDSNNSNDEINIGKNNKPILIARERLLAAEAGIERRYLKPPLGFKSNTILLTTTGSDEYADNAADENATSGLIRWRDAVRVCESGSLLALLLQFLESCIAWDKSIMRASCQFCNSGENEAELLLCDGCDKGYHTYCFKPKMETIPEGDWFCFECSNKNSIDKVCVICGKKGKLINCDTCPKVFHPNCLDPPIIKPQKGRWFCFACVRKSKKPVKTTAANFKQQKANLVISEEKSCDKSNANNNQNNRSNISSKDNKKKSSRKEVLEQPVVEKEIKKDKRQKEVKEVQQKDKKSRNSESKDSKNKEKLDSSNNSKDRNKKKLRELGTSILEPKKNENYNPSPFEILLEDIVQHKDAWPFLTPVDTNEFPQYKKIIKKPMDFQTMKNKLDSGCYTDPENFLTDCRLIFDNCNTFNEDESPVCKAGQNLREFIETRWKELIE